MAGKFSQELATLILLHHFSFRCPKYIRFVQIALRYFVTWWGGSNDAMTMFSRTKVLGSVADQGCLTRIPDKKFFHPGSQIPDPGSRIRIKEFKGTQA
jgi:hypothetical protein